MALLDELRKTYKNAENTYEFRENQSFRYKYLVEIAFDQIHNQSQLNIKSYQRDVMYIINSIVEAVLYHKPYVVTYRKWENLDVINELQKSLDIKFTKIFDNGYKLHGWT